MKKAIKKLQGVTENIALAIAWVGFVVAVPAAFIAAVLLPTILVVMLIKFAVWIYLTL